ncbi:MAG: hypothetical protein NVSMB42_09410 [Herpetosiphon sp.]
MRLVFQQLTGRGVRVQFKKEHLAFTRADLLIATVLLPVIGAFTPFERASIRERQREGIAVAKQQGVDRGRNQALAPHAIARLKARAATGEARTRLAREFGVRRETLYQYIRA